MDGTAPIGYYFLITYSVLPVRLFIVIMIIRVSLPSIESAEDASCH